ncbi:hypothetical protein ZWY2020_006432 [Hordeum vulgare]|nr:hypothetical protein ZWY2020_006432 [Hordeum vulgare]
MAESQHHLRPRRSPQGHDGCRDAYMMCNSTISGVALSKTLIDDGAGLNVISVEAFDTLWLSQERLAPSKPFSRVVEGSVTFGTRSNFRTKQIDFDIARIHLPYNAILGYPALALFKAVTHPD